MGSCPVLPDFGREGQSGTLTRARCCGDVRALLGGHRRQLQMGRQHVGSASRFSSLEPSFLLQKPACPPGNISNCPQTTHRVSPTPTGCHCSPGWYPSLQCLQNPRTQSHASPGLLLPAGCPLGVWGVWWGQGGTPQVAWSGEAASTLGAQGASQTSELGSFPQGLQHFTLRNTVHRAQSRQVLCSGNRAPMPEQPCPPPALEIALSRSETHGGRSCLTRVILSPGHSAPRTPEVNAA